MKRPASIARAIALRVLREVEEKKGFANLLLEAEFSRTRLTPEDRGLAYHLVYGVLRNRNRLDWAISRYADRTVQTLTAWIRNCLRIGAYQLLAMPDLRSSVAVDESVRLAHRYGHRGTASFVNAVLRSLASKGPGVFPSWEDEPEEYLVVSLSHPRWLVRRWLHRYGPDLAKQMCEANNLPPPLTLRWNGLKGGRPGIYCLQDLEKPAKSDIIPEGIFIEGPRPVQATPLYEEGRIDIQGLSSMLMPHLLGVRGGRQVLDACAGSGGKSCHMADLMGNRGMILCIDRNEQKLRALVRRAKRLGASICSPVCADAEANPPWRESGFDFILVDAPCSSIGIIRRHPEVRWLRKEEDLHELSLVQARILSQAARALKEGGRLLYCTCSLEPEETERIMEGFLAQNPHCNLEDLRDRVPPAWQHMVGRDGALRLLPVTEGADGFFAFSVTK